MEVGGGGGKVEVEVERERVLEVGGVRGTLEDGGWRRIGKVEVKVKWGGEKIGCESNEKVQIFT